MPTEAWRPRPIDVLLASLCVGLLGGSIDVLARLVLRYGFQRVKHQGCLLLLDPQVVWVAPLSNALAFGLLAGVLILILRRRLGTKVEQALILILTIVAFFDLRWIATQVHIAAFLLLAVGVASLVCRWLRSNPQQFHLVARRTALCLGVAAAIAGAAVQAGRAAHERALAGDIPATSAPVPNVLLIVWDTVRAESLSAYGCARATTPQLEKLCSRGVRFDFPVSTAPWTLPAHASMFTGQLPFDLSPDFERALDRTHPTLAEELAKNGHQTAGFVSNYSVCSREMGLSRGFAHYEDYPLTPGTFIKGSFLGRFVHRFLRRWPSIHPRPEFKDAECINRNFLEWLDRNQGRPYFAFLNYMDAHAPYFPPSPWDRAFHGANPRDPWNHNARSPVTQDIEAERNAYERCIAYLDDQLGRLLDELSRRGSLENTLVIVTSDHGDQFGEHGLIDHANSAYLQLLHVPLVVAWPKRLPQGIVVTEPVSTKDLGATVLDALGYSKTLAGSSLLSHLRGDAGIQEAVISQARPPRNSPAFWPVSKGDMQSVVYLGYHYILNGDGKEELYDYKLDPGEEHNLVRSKMAQRMLMRLRKQLVRAAGNAGG